MKSAIYLSTLPKHITKLANKKIKRYIDDISHDKNRGLNFTVYKKLVAASGLEHKELARYVAIPPATLQRRAKAGQFNVDESDRLYRFAEVLNAASELFEGDNERARQWLLNPVRGLGGRRPLEMIATSAETEAVLDLIGRLEHGVFA